MNDTVEIIEQRSPEWYALRLGKVTSSRIADVVRRLKDGKTYAASRANYRADLVAERLTRVPADGYVSPAMKAGTEQEPAAIEAYEFLAGRPIVRGGFVPHPTIEMAGASPDALVGDDGLVEFKCPYPATHIATLLHGKIDPDYIMQMQWQMACTKRQWCDFASFNDRLPYDMQLHVTRVYRSAEAIAILEAEVLAFLGEVAQEEAALRQRFAERNAA